MLIDCFTFFNEIDVLKVRLTELYDKVDKFVLVEGTKTQSGNDKPLYFELNKHLFEKFADKIIHVKVEEWPEKTDDWRLEIYQRRCVRIALDSMNLRDNDLVMISDMDEIPYPDKIPASLPENIVVSLRMAYHVYRYDLRVKDFSWNGTVVAPWGLAKHFDFNSLFKLRDNLPPHLYVEKGGVHYGYQGGPAMIHHKYFSCVEPYDKVMGIPDWDNFQKIFNERAVDGGSFIYSDNLDKRDLRLEKAPAETLHPSVKQLISPEYLC